MTKLWQFGVSATEAVVRLPGLVATEVVGESSTFILGLAIVVLYTQSLMGFRSPISKSPAALTPLPVLKHTHTHTHTHTRMRMYAHSEGIKAPVPRVDHLLWTCCWLSSTLVLNTGYASPPPLPLFFPFDIYEFSFIFFLFQFF